jgi:hypothetical protein
MRYWKFLRAGGTSPFTGYRWQPGEWYDADRASACHCGFHACRPVDLPYWLTDELWRIELAGVVVESEHKVAAQRARITTRVTGWTGAAADQFSLACLRRIAGHAADELAEAGIDGPAENLARVLGRAEVQAWTQAATTGMEAAARRQAPAAERLCGFVLDAVEALSAYPPASTAYIAARAANQRSTAAVADPFAAERAWQAQWLVERLGLDDGR